MKRQRFHTTLTEETISMINDLIDSLKLRYANDVIELTIKQKWSEINELDKTRNK